jgi:hypothetical protein
VCMLSAYLQVSLAAGLFDAWLYCIFSHSGIACSESDDLTGLTWIMGTLLYGAGLIPGKVAASSRSARAHGGRLRPSTHCKQ